MVFDVGVVKNHIKPKADSTLHNMRKDDLIEYIRCLEHNYNVAVSFNENQARYVESLGFFKMDSHDPSDLISRSRLLRDPYFQEGRYPESHLLRMAIGEQPAVHVVPVNYVLSNIPKMTHKKTVVTNGDKIRAMSDEELADWLLSVMKHGVACFAEGVFPYAPCRNEDHNCLQCGVAWLKQPAEV